MATTPKLPLVNTLTIEQRRKLLDFARLRVTDQKVALGNFRTLLRFRDKAYQRELNTTAAHIQAVRANLAGNARAIQDMTVPIILPQVESATAYQAGVFLTSYPIFGVVTTPQQQDLAMAFETALGDQSIRYGWAQELIKVFRNGFKYNFGPACVTWEKTPLRSVVTNTSVNSQAGLAAIQEYSYGGNKIKAVDPYNCFMDMTVDPSQLHIDGEFFGWNELYPRTKLKRLLTMLDSAKTTSAREAYESSFAGATGDVTSGLQYHTPDINPYVDIGSFPQPGHTNWGSWLGLTPGNGANKIAYKDNYVVTHFFCRAAPSDFGAQGNKLKIYHAIIVNWSHVIFVEEMNVGYDYLPCVIAQPMNDGLGYQTKSMLDHAMPFQDMSSALWNIALESKRRQLFDRLVYNPKLIDKKDVDPASSVARIPLRNANLSREDNPMQKAIYQIPYREDNLASTLQMSDMISAMADQAAGQNKVDRGQFQKGNKTKTEFETTQMNSNARQQLAAITLEQQFMTPVKEIIKSNTLQFQPAGKILNRDAKELVEVDPVALRQAILEFKMTDGMLPADKMLNAEVLTVFLQTAQALPGVAAEYDVMGMFLYWAKLRGAYWLEDFKRNPAQQQQFMQAVQGMAGAQSTGEAQGAVMQQAAQVPTSQS